MAIKATEYNGTTTLRCTRCGELLNVENKDARDAYHKINAFRALHEHLEQYKSIRGNV
jgi:uncharacterized C2H2 Zn-finger protein